MPEQTNEEVDELCTDIPKWSTIKKLFTNKYFAILIVLTLITIGTTIVVGQIYDSKKLLEDKVLIPLEDWNNGNFTRAVLYQAEQINFLTECIKTKSEVECKTELNNLLK